MRYFQSADGELKRIINNERLRPRIIDILGWHASDGSARITAVYLDKAGYEGPYLTDSPSGGKSARKFMNHVLRRLLELHFAQHAVVSPECELIIDRVSMTLQQELNLRKYLLDNWRLPHIDHLTHADSRYVEGLQIADLVAALIREIESGKNEKYLPADLSFITRHDITRGI